MAPSVLLQSVLQFFVLFLDTAFNSLDLVLGGTIQGLSGSAKANTFVTSSTIVVSTFCDQLFEFVPVPEHLCVGV